MRGEGREGGTEGSVCEDGGGRMVSFSPLFWNSTHQSTFQYVRKWLYVYIVRPTVFVHVRWSTRV